MSIPVRNPVRGAIYGALTTAGDLLAMLGDPTPTGYAQSIYHDQAPDNANFPFIIFSKSSGIPTETFGDYTRTSPGVLESDLWLIKGVVRGDDVLGESPSDRADKIAARIKALLNDYTLSIAGGVPTLYLRRESDVEYAELADGVVYRHSGSLYRVITSPF